MGRHGGVPSSDTCDGKTVKETVGRLQSAECQVKNRNRHSVSEPSKSLKERLTGTGRHAENVVPLFRRSGHGGSRTDADATAGAPEEPEPVSHAQESSLRQSVEAESHTGPEPSRPEVEEPIQPANSHNHPPAWADHPITKALEAFYGNPAMPNPVDIIADSVRPATSRHGEPSRYGEHREARQRYGDVPYEDPPIRPIPAEAPQETPEIEEDTGSADEFWEIWLGHQDHLRNQCLRMMSGNKADAEDALSNAMLRASQKFSKYSDRIVNERAWLSKLVHNVCIDHFRREKRTQCFAIEQEPEAHVSEAMFTEPQRSPEELLLSHEQLTELERCIQQLSNNLRVPLMLRCVEGRSYADIAEELDLRADTVRKRIQLARDFLRGSNIR